MKSRSSKRAKALAIPDSVKERVWARDEGRCVWCGRSGAYVFPEAHFIPRRKGGLGMEENILTLCRPCHNRFDNGDKEDRQRMRDYFRDYLKDCYPDWDETKLRYRKW